MNRRIFKFAYRIVAVLLLASISTFAFVWTGSSASEQAVENARNQKTTAESKRSSDSDAPEAATLKAEKRGFPLLNLRDGKKVESQFVAADGSAAQSLGASGARPRTLTNADLNADGASDLVVGYASGNGGHIAVYQGSLDTLSATSPEVFEGMKEGRFPAPFLPKARLINLPVAPDFVGTGDFNRDGSKDIIAAGRNDAKAFLLLGNGEGAFKTTFVELPGQVTAMLADNIDPLDNVADIAFAVNTENGASLVVYRGSTDAFGDEPDVYPLPAEAASLAIGQLDENAPMDIIAAVGGRVAIIHGSYPDENQSARASQVEILDQVFDAAAVRVGNFVWDRENRPEIAFLSTNGSVGILERGKLDRRMFTEAEFKARSLRHRELMEQEEAVRNLNYQSRQAKIVWGKWNEADRIQVASPVNALSASSASFFSSARMTPFGVEDLVVVDTASRKVNVLVSNNEELKKSGESFALSGSGDKAVVSLDVESGTPVAALPMRLSVMNRPGIVMINEESSEPSYALAAPAGTFNVNTMADTYDGTCSTSTNGCSLRDALDDAAANSDSDIINIPAGTITINPALGGPDQDTVIDPAAIGSGDWDVWYDTTINGAGQGSTILQAAAAQPGHDRVLDAIQVSAGVPDITIAGVTIKNGRCRADFPCVDGGGLRYAVDNLSVLTINNSTIDNNRTEVNTANPANNGGGIFAGQSDVVFNGITVTNNTTAFVASGCPVGGSCGGEGGGAFAGISYNPNPTSLTITNSTFTGNTANSMAGTGGRGGAYAGSPNSVSITGGTFNNNVAMYDAGALRLFTPTTISGSTINNNSAKQNGGGIWSDPLANDNTPLTNTFTNITMRGNTADSDGVLGSSQVTRGDGGAIYHGRGTLNLSNPTIGGTNAGEGNTAFNGGGIARSYSQFTAAIFNASTLNINNGGSITGNLAINNGGGIIHDATKSAATGNASALNIGTTTAVTITNNNARNHGGAIAVITGSGTTPAASATLNNMTLRNNVANSDNSGGGDGGALYHDSVVSGGGTTFTGSLTIGGSGFANSAVNGGGIRNNAGTVNIPTGASVTHNTATGTGGGISNAGTLSALTNAVITNNTATGNGGGVHNTGTLGTFANPALNFNTGATGGGIFSSNGALTINGGTVNNNTATTGKGGGVEHSGTSASAITGSSILNNTGSGVHITGTGSLDVKTSTVTGNSGDGITKIGSGVGSHFDSNVIHSNGELGIDLLDNGVTPNDTNDTDSGPNNLQNFPVLNYVKRGDRKANVTLNAPNGKYRVQYYANTTCDASGHGEGEVLLLSEVKDIITGNTLTYESAALTADFMGKEQITATITHDATPNDNNFDTDGSTSEFSACRKVNTLPTFTAVQTPSRQQGSPASNSQIATVADPDQTLNTLVVTVNGGASATVNGVTVSNIAVDASGNVTADVVASCNATNANFTLRVTDSATEFNETTLNVTVTPNTPPTLGNYPNTTVNAGSSGGVITPDAAPTDNGTVATLTAAAPGFTGTFVGNTTTGTVTVNGAAPVGVYTVTVTATDNCGATTTKTFQLTVNAIPTITGATISRQQGSPSANSQITTVNDADQSEETLVVTVNGGASATVNGVAVSNIAVDASGNVTADVVASCTATNATFTLTVTDSVGASSNATLTVNVTPNTPPTVGTYSATNLPSGGGTTVTPSVAPGDNGSITGASATASGAFTGTLSVNSATGVVTISNANPGGSFTVSVTFTDNCGATSTEQFTLNVTYSISGTVSYGIIQVNQTQKKVPDVLLSVTGAPTVSDTTDSMGFYQLDNLTAGGNYTVTPTKTTDANGITPFDATMILRHVASGGAGPNALSPDQQIVADTNGDGNITPFDATLVLRYVVAMGPTANTGQVGTWKFVPPSTNYNPLSSSQSNQNYTAYLIGEVDGNWAPSNPLASNDEAKKQETALVTNENSSSVTAEAPMSVQDQQELIGRSGKTKESTATEVQLLLPVNSSAPNGSVVLIPVWLNNDSNNRISSFKFAVRFDPNVLQPEQTAIEATNSLIGSGFTVVSDTATSGRLGVAGTSLNNAVTDSGALVYLRFRVVGTINDSASALNFETTSQEGGAFEDNFGNKVSSSAVNGSFAALDRKKSAKR
jgi:CSLREA domain-containing protein